MQQTMKAQGQKQLPNPADDHHRVADVRRLASKTDDPDIMDLLCTLAVGDVSDGLRNALIAVLRADPETACNRFIDDAIHATDPQCRQFALENLYQLGCRRAETAVINGLADPDAWVREAAAMNVPLYADRAVADAFERYLECNRFGLILDFIRWGRAGSGSGADDSDDEDVSGHPIGDMRFCSLPGW